MSGRSTDLTAAVHALAATLHRHRFPFSRRDIQPNGVYLLFEDGESVPSGDVKVERIVRVGTHTGEGRLGRRVGIHFSGDRRRSVFRRHLGGALLARDAPDDPRLSTWYGEKRIPIPDVEHAVTALLRDRFSFCCIPVAEKDERLDIERGLIALLAQHLLGPPSRGWLGGYAFRPEIRRSGLWNTLHIDATPIGQDGLDRLMDLTSKARSSAPS